jgi:drug/metabolite transporter (DMT)-like permease
MSNVAIGMLSLFTYPVITSLLEPLLLKTKFQGIHLLLGAMVITGTVFLVPDFNLEHDYIPAIALGLISALAYSLRNLITKSKVGTYNGSVLMFYQLVVVSVCLAPTYFLSDTAQLPDQISWVIFLALVTTAIGHTWFIYSFRNFSVTSASFISSLQPVYGILIGMFFLKEYPAASTIFGGLLILASVLMESLNTLKSKPLKRS